MNTKNCDHEKYVQYILSNVHIKREEVIFTQKEKIDIYWKKAIKKK